VEVLQLITEHDKRIYNTYLKVSRGSNNLPFKYRKDFEKLDEKTFVAIKKVSSFLRKFPHIKMEEYFKAPKAYTLYNKKQTLQDPDSTEQLNNIKTSLVFIYNFCKQNNILVPQYIDHKTNNEYSFILHLREHNICLYTLFGYSDFEKRVKSRDAEVVRFIIGEEIYNNISMFRTKLYNSSKAIKLVELGFKKISNRA
jgi:hypothetical protein